MSTFANALMMGDIYSQNGPTTAARATGGGGVSPMQAVAASGPTTEPEVAAAIGAMGKPLSWWFLFVVVLFGSGYLVKRYAPNEFSNIKITPYNVVTIGWIAILGLTFWKVVFTRFKVPGLSSLVLSA